MISPFVAPQSRWYQTGRFLRDPGPRLLRRQRGRHGRPGRASRPSWTTCSGSGSTACGCCRSTSRRCGTAATTSATSGPSCPSTAIWPTPSSWSRRRTSGAARDRRPGHEPHLRPASVVPRVPPGPHQPEGRLVRVARRRLANTATPGSSSSTREKSNWTFDAAAGPVLLAPFLLPPARPQLRQPRGGRHMLDVCPLLAGHRAGRLPPRRRAVSVRAGRHQLREPARDPRVPGGLRKEVDSLYPGRVLLAEANQWPEDVVEYFGEGDECHMCFHFPVMPRMFMAVRREQRYPSARSWPGPLRSPTAASGASSCATTTS